MADLTKEAILAMEQQYLPRILMLEVALLTTLHTTEDFIESIEDEEVKTATVKHKDLIISILNNKEYLEHVLDEDMKYKLTITKIPLDPAIKEK